MALGFGVFRKKLILLPSLGELEKGVIFQPTEYAENITLYKDFKLTGKDHLEDIQMQRDDWSLSKIASSGDK